MSNLDRARDPNLPALEFKELLELRDLYIYEALDLNESASERYMAYLDTQPEVNYFPADDLEDNDQTLQSANNGDHLAQFFMGSICMENGDVAAANEWFRKAAVNGNIVCAYNYAITLSDVNEQLVWLYPPAYKGVPEAQRAVGLIFYEKGMLDIAEIWFGLAMRRENLKAINDLGVICWDRGQSDKAVEYWQKAADLGDMNALSNLEMASSTSLFDDEDFDYVFDGNESTRQYSFEQAPIQEVQSSARDSFGID